jgi:DNA repair protein RadA/Sms
MPKRPAVFECTACGQRSGKWLGRCPGCGGWNTFEAVPEEVRRSVPSAAVEPVPVTATELEETPRAPTGIAGVDRVLGGGLVPGSVVLLAGEPGVGKSTLLLQIAALQAAAGPVLYISAEESARQVAMRAQRLGALHDAVLLLPEPGVEAAVATARAARPCLVIVDSVQTMLSERVPAVPGTVTQVREVASQMVEYAKRSGPPVILVGHVTKEGMVAGPKSLEHLVDVVLEFAGSTSHPHRTLRATKNRFGPALELALFAMTDAGLEEVENPSAVLLADRRTGAAGSAVAVVLEGTTPLLVEVQALVSRSPLAYPRRVAQGVDAGRLALLLAVLEKRLGLRLGDRDVFVNVAGGLGVDEPAADLAVAAAVLSSARERPLAGDTALFGEVGLLGEVRAVTRAGERLREAAAMGFARCGCPAATASAPRVKVDLVPLASVTDLTALLTVVDSPQ